MIFEILEPPSVDPNSSPEEQIGKLRLFLTSLVERLNAAFYAIEAENNFNATTVGTPDERATGKAKRIVRSVSSIDMANQQIKNCRAPTDSKDVVTVEYLNSVLNKPSNSAKEGA